MGSLSDSKKINRICIIADGTLNDKSFHKDILKDADLIICADGGANHAHTLGITPDYIIGDMDSIREDVLKIFQSNDKTGIIRDKDQDKTDTELAIGLAQKFRPKEIILLGAIGTRMDHTLANILCLTKISAGADKKINAKIIDDKNEIMLARDSPSEVAGNSGDVVSVIPLTDVEGLDYSGLKWDVKNADKRFGWFGICNQLLRDKGRINLKKGKVLIIKTKGD